MAQPIEVANDLIAQVQLMGKRGYNERAMRASLIRGAATIREQAELLNGCNTVINKTEEEQLANIAQKEAALAKLHDVIMIFASRPDLMGLCGPAETTVLEGVRAFLNAEAES